LNFKVYGRKNIPVKKGKTVTDHQSPPRKPESKSVTPVEKHQPVWESISNPHEQGRQSGNFLARYRKQLSLAEKLRMSF